MKNKLKDIYIGKLRSIRPILESWLSVQDEYFIQTKEYSWLYKERASISILAAAVWKSGNVALEEYSTIKGATDGTIKKGRCDIYFTAGKEGFAGEAKHVWISAGKSIHISLKKKLNDSLLLAKKSSIQLKSDEGRRLAICFAVPYFPKKDKNDLKNLINNFIEELSQTNAQAFAYYFVVDNFGDCFFDNYYYPGNVILLKEIKRARIV